MRTKLCILLLIFGTTFAQNEYTRVVCGGVAFVCCEYTQNRYTWVQWPEEHQDEVCRIVGSPATTCSRGDGVYNNGNLTIAEVCRMTSPGFLIYWY